MSIDQAIIDSFRTYHAHTPQLTDRPQLYQLKNWITCLLYQSAEPKSQCHSCYMDSCYVLKMCACGLSTYCGICIFNIIASKISTYDDIINTMRGLCPACKTGRPLAFYEAIQNHNTQFLCEIRYYEVANLDIFQMYNNTTQQVLHLEHKIDNNYLTLYMGFDSIHCPTNKIKMKRSTLTADIFNVIYYKALEFYKHYESTIQQPTTAFRWNRMCQFINRELENNERNVFLDYYLLKVLMYTIRTYSIH